MEGLSDWFSPIDCGAAPGGMAVLQLLRVDIGRRKCCIRLTNIGSDDVVANSCRSQAPNCVSLEQVEDPAESSVFTSRFKHSAGDLGCCLPVVKVNIGGRRDSGEGLCVGKCTACKPVSRRSARGRKGCMEICTPHLTFNHCSCLVFTRKQKVNK